MLRELTKLLRWGFRESSLRMLLQDLKNRKLIRIKTDFSPIIPH